MIEIREMKFEDYENIKDKLQKEFDEFWTPSILKSELESKNSKYIVALKGKEVVGFAGIIILPDGTEVTNIVTKKVERKKGIGKLLLDKLINMTITEKKEVISLEVNEKNIIAINLYKNFGFEKVGRRKKYYNGIDDAIIMTKKIKNL
ncbi:MAG TPA: ribosomal protein S18-alanine N-acetyltransferase [Candidatus Scatovivens faecipullorum]|nr:ribosomal protein S18-alanine N-acetyltransferase [Candidatus Scatovivens faecipullorum]